MAENTIIHEISLAGYKATSTGGMLDLGTWGSYGIEKLHLTLDAAWQDLTITAFFNVNGKVVAKRVVGKDGYADVPWEATKENTFSGCLAFEGSINGQRRISTNLNYKVTNHSETTDSDPVPTDDRWNQFVTETKGYRDGAFEAAERANTRSEDAETASEDAQAAARAAKASENAAAASASNAAADAAKAGPYAEAARAAQEAAESARDKAIAAQQAAENAAAAAADSKSAADTLAAEAARAALAAENSKAAANNAANLAGENATAAQQAAATATAAANDAGQSASDAAASKAAAETAAKAAQDAQTATAAAKAEAVKAQEAAQTAAKSAQDAQAASENVRDDAQTAQQGAEAARDAAAKSAEAAAKSEANVKQSADTLAESVKNITPDDSSIGDKPWSSKHIIDMLCPPLEESGNPVVCYPVAGYSLGVKASWEPVQEGSGTPSPENIRPIKGRDSVTVERCGENVIEFLSTEDSSSDIKIAVDAEKNITLNGTLAGKGNISIGTCRLHWVAGKTYTMYVKKVGGSVSLGSGDGITFAYALFTTDYNHFFRGDTNSTNLDVYIASDAALVETELVFMLQCWRKGTVFNNFKFQIEVVEGTTTPSTYAPYNGQSNTLTLPSTIYGGEVDAVSGEGQDTWKSVSLDGTEKWNTWGVNKNNTNVTGFFTYDINDYSNDGSDINKILCSTMSNEEKNIWSGKNMGVGLANSGNSKYLIYCVTTNTLPDTTDDKKAIASFKTFLANLYAAGTPVQVAYKLATQTPFTATGAQPMPALAGANTVLTDADSATVTGRADPIKRITDLEDAVASQT